MWSITLVLLLCCIVSSRCAYHCAFLHGLGQSWPFAVVDNLAAYWGPIRAHTAHMCGSYSFMQANTVDFAWYSAELHAVAVQTLLGAPTGAPVVAITHSMGGLTLASAMQHLLPRALPHYWVAIGTPWNGSQIIQHIAEACAARDNSLLRDIAIAVGRCSVVTGQLKNSDASLIDWDALRALRRGLTRFPNATVCGTSVIGDGGFSAFAFAALRTLTQSPGKEITDGLVPLEDCELFPSEKQHRLTLNHADIACMTGDAHACDTIANTLW